MHGKGTVDLKWRHDHFCDPNKSIVCHLTKNPGFCCREKTNPSGDFPVLNAQISYLVGVGFIILVYTQENEQDEMEKHHF